MPILEVVEPYADPPRLRTLSPPPVERAEITVDHGYLDLRDVSLSYWDLPEDATEIDLTGCVVDGVDFTAGTVLEARNCTFTGCDLSQVRVRRLEGVVLQGCKLVGTDISETRVEDVSLEQCHLRYVNLRMARLRRIAFVGCSLDDVDLYDATIDQATFPQSTLDQVQCARASWSGVDLRSARSLGVVQLGSLSGVLISEPQVIELAYTLALQAGADVDAGFDGSE